MDNEIMERYSVINEKNLREIVLIRGNGCKWRKCRFCDYHLDFSSNEEENYELNLRELSRVTGVHKKLEIINSGSFVDLSAKTIDLIEKICVEKGILEVHFECHYTHREETVKIRERFNNLGILVKIKIGVETFNSIFRESYLVKGITTDNPADIAKYFDECCLLQGISGQTKDSMILDIQTGLEHFERVCVNIMQENGMPVKPDPTVIKCFIEEVYPIFKDDIRVDILLENTAFGVGGVTTNAK
ncbi:MAG: radical SAM protein [Clostridia bacterium]